MAHSTDILCYAVVASLLYLVLGAIRCLYFTRISHIPGPRLAALTYYYQAYWDIYPHKGQFLFHCHDLHARYGPVVRIGPDEVHVKDASFYSELYTGYARKRNKSPLWFWMADTDTVAGRSAWTTLDADLHRLRRSAFAQTFSKARVVALSPKVARKALELKEEMLKRADTGELVNLVNACSALTLEIITEYTFGRPIRALNLPDLAAEWTGMLHTGLRVHPLCRAFPIFRWLVASQTMQKLSRWTMTQNLQKFTIRLNEIFQETWDKVRTEKSENLTSADSDEIQVTVLHEILAYDKLPLAERSFARVENDASIFVGAGMETTGRTLGVTLYHLLANPAMHAKLKAEVLTVLDPSSNDVPPLHALEKLPYLTAVITEGLRIAHGVAGRLPRIAPDEDLICAGITIPRGTTISESQYFLHTDPVAFPAPLEFHPERWMGDVPAEMHNHFVPFGKGARACVGLNLAWSEMYYTIAILTAGVKMKLAQTTARDATTVSEYFTGCLPVDSNGLRVRILGRA